MLPSVRWAGDSLGMSTTAAPVVKPAKGRATAPTKAAKPGGKDAPPEKTKKRESGTERWPKECVSSGSFFIVPWVFFRDLVSFGTKQRHFRPHHLWLLLALQADRFRDNPPRYYWVAIAGWCGRDRNTVRRWGVRPRSYGAPDHPGVQEARTGRDRGTREAQRAQPVLLGTLREEDPRSPQGVAEREVRNAEYRDRKWGRRWGGAVRVEPPK